MLPGEQVTNSSISSYLSPERQTLCVFHPVSQYANLISDVSVLLFALKLRKNIFHFKYQPPSSNDYDHKSSRNKRCLFQQELGSPPVPKTHMGSCAQPRGQLARPAAKSINTTYGSPSGRPHLRAIQCLRLVFPNFNTLTTLAMKAHGISRSPTTSLAHHQNRALQLRSFLLAQHSSL